MWRALVLIAAACGSRDEPPAVATPVRGRITADSTVAARDYIGPAACGECHPDEHARWTKSLHRVMNQRAADDTVIGRFDGSSFDYRGGTVTFGRDRTMTLVRGARRVRYRVTRTIGVRGLQEYVGVADDSTEEVRLPFGWWPRRAGWYPQPYFDPWLAEDAFDAYAPVREPWAERCPWCHSTYPFAQRLGRTVGHGLEQFFDGAPHGERLVVGEQVTTGISCESCHLGGRAHQAGAAIHFVPIGAPPRPGAPVATTFAGERVDPAIVNRVCAQCHSGPSPRLADGTATRNSSEALDLAASPCTTARCTDCHDPHLADARGDDARAIAACARCHAAEADPARGHAGPHRSATCLDCHMPRLVMGIDHHVRTHRIQSPAAATTLAACNLCHLDRTIEWTAAELRAGYEVRLDPRVVLAYGDRPVGEVWLASSEPAVRLIAASAYARSPLARSALPDVAKLLDDDVAYVRAWAAFAVEDIVGHPIDYDPRLPADARRAQLARLRLR